MQERRDREVPARGATLSLESTLNALERGPYLATRGKRANIDWDSGRLAGMTFLQRQGTSSEMGRVVQVVNPLVLSEREISSMTMRGKNLHSKPAALVRDLPLRQRPRSSVGSQIHEMCIRVRSSAIGANRESNRFICLCLGFVALI
jgi:hypothetical protein